MSETAVRVILITGANGGIGQAIARAFLAERPENQLWLGVRANRARADELAGQFPERCRCVELEATDRAAWAKAVDAILSEHQRLDVLVNNAGRHQDGLLATLPVAAWESVLSANLDATFHGCQAVLPAMIAQRNGRIVNMASLSALLPPAGQTNYAAAKAGIVALTQALAKEMARLNITVNVVCPGYIETETMAGWSAPELQNARARVPMRRLGKPEEVAAAVRFLAGPDAAYITGSTLKVDGGIY